MADDWLTVIGLCVAGGLLWLMLNRWFWIAAFSLATVAAAFTVLACIIHFQILGAVGAFVLLIILGLITESVARPFMA